MTWDFAETNPFSSTGGDIEGLSDGTADVLGTCVPQTSVVGTAFQLDAGVGLNSSQQVVCSSDPPYYDNIAYADLADCFYVWLRLGAGALLPSLFSTMLTPKDDEIIADPSRRGGRAEAQAFFESRIKRAIANMVRSTVDTVPTTLYYAYKQEESEGVSHDTLVASTGWETFLTAVSEAGFAITGTLPIHTEGPTRMRAMDSNALATSIVLVCRKRPPTALVATRADFRRLLRQELPAALKAFTAA
jgi:putative DNA methylase